MTEELTQSLKDEAERLGFQLSGVCPAVTPLGYASFLEWLDAGYHGEMSYLPNRKDAYAHPKFVMDGCKSVLMLGMSYHRGTDQEIRSGSGRVAKYAWSGHDYHDLIHARLKKLVAFARTLDDNIHVRGVVDTAPLLEREFAQLAGLGWQAKNTMLINREWGSWFFIAALLVNIELKYDEPFEKNHCGTCTACIEACPTDAFVQPGRLDANRCISYLTIELRNPIEPSLREGMGDWVFGCDICQDVCPWNRKANQGSIEAFEPLDWQNPLELESLFTMDDESFRAQFRKTPFWRTRRRGILRNAAIVLGNARSSSSLECLFSGLADEEALVRGTCAWAIGRIGEHQSLGDLRKRLDDETEHEVRCEIQLAIEMIESPN